MRVAPLANQHTLRSLRTALDLDFHADLDAGKRIERKNARHEEADHLDLSIVTTERCASQENPAGRQK